MEKFTVDLEKVLDDFEFSEDKNEINPSQNLAKNQYSTSKNIPNYEFSGTGFKRSSFEPINLADADFSATLQAKPLSEIIHQQTESNQNEITRSYVFPHVASGSNVIEKNIEHIYSEARNKDSCVNMGELSIDSVLNSSSSSSSSSSSTSSADTDSSDSGEKVFSYHRPIMNKVQGEMSTLAPDIIDPTSLPDVTSATTKCKPTDKFDLINDRVLNAVIDSSSSDAKPIGFNSIPQPSESDLNKYLEELDEEDNSVEEVSSLPVVSTDEDLSSSQNDDTVSSSIDVKPHETNSEFENLISESSNSYKQNSTSDVELNSSQEPNIDENNILNIQDQKDVKITREIEDLKYNNVKQIQSITHEHTDQSIHGTNINTYPMIKENFSEYAESYDDVKPKLRTSSKNNDLIENNSSEHGLKYDIQIEQIVKHRVDETNLNHVNTVEQIDIIKKINKPSSVDDSTIHTTNECLNIRQENIETQIISEQNDELNLIATKASVEQIKNENIDISPSTDISVETLGQISENEENKKVNTIYPVTKEVCSVKIKENVVINNEYRENVDMRNENVTPIEIIEEGIQENEIMDESTGREIINTNYVIEISQPCIDYRAKLSGSKDKVPGDAQNKINDDGIKLSLDTDLISELSVNVIENEISESNQKEISDINESINIGNISKLDNVINKPAACNSTIISVNSASCSGVHRTRDDSPSTSSNTNCVNEQTIEDDCDVQKNVNESVEPINHEIETNKNSNLVNNDINKDNKTSDEDVVKKEKDSLTSMNNNRIKECVKSRTRIDFVKNNIELTKNRLRDEPVSRYEPVVDHTRVQENSNTTTNERFSNYNSLASPDCYIEEKPIASIHGENVSTSTNLNDVLNTEENLTSDDSMSTKLQHHTSERFEQTNHPKSIIHVEETADVPQSTSLTPEPSNSKPVRPNSLDLPSSPSVSLSPSETPPNISDSEQPNQQLDLDAENVNQRDFLLGKKAPFWVPDNMAPNCMHCHIKFTLVKRRHHCRACGQVLCSKCCSLKATLEYLQFSQERVCLICYEILSKQPTNGSTSGALQNRKPNPNNPMEYCSTIPPLQQVASTANQPPPSVMVPVSVLKREGSLKTKEGTKQVMFSDGIKPGGDLTELDSERESTSKLPVIRKNRTTKRVGTPPGNLFMHKRPLNPDSNSFIPKSGLPPIVMKNHGEITYSELSMPLIANESAVKFALHRNLFAHVKKLNLKCCLGKKRTAWNVTSEGLNCVGQDEIAFVLESKPDEEYPPQDIFRVILSIYTEASRGSTVTEMCFVPSPIKDIFGNKDHGGFIFIRPTFQCLTHLVLPEPPYLFGVLIHRWEIPWAKLFPLRLVLRMGAELKCYPSPILSIRDREPLFMDIGHTIINLLADFRSFAYTLPTVRGLFIHMESNKTTVIIPRNHYDQVAKAINNSNDSYLAFAGNFSSEADSHLVCVQNVDDENSYNTQTIHRQGKEASITGLSFIVFNASLKSSDGMSGKTSINEDGLMVNILVDTMNTLRTALHEMKEFTVECGPHAEESIQVLWGPNDLNFNVGAKSCIDEQPFDGVQSIRVHGGTDYTGGNKLIRWTEVFIIENSDINVKTTEDPIDHMKKLSENIARATCISFISLIDALSSANVEKFAVRVRIHPDDVGYEAGTAGEKFSPTYMHNLDEGLVPIIHQAAVNSHSPITLELVFRIMEQG